ncbi:MAG: hydrogenase maturation protease [bacterium]|nr:hydrogenase maturation protease [bacterium]
MILSQNQALVVCIGNELAGDDAVGWHVYRKLVAHELPESVTVLFLSVSGFALLDVMSGQDLLLIIDAVSLGNPIGTVTVFAEVELPLSPGAAVSIHGVGIREALEIASALTPDAKPKNTMFIGIEGSQFDQLGSDLHPEVAKAIEPVVDIVLRLLEQDCTQSLPELHSKLESKNVPTNETIEMRSL